MTIKILRNLITVPYLNTRKGVAVAMMQTLTISVANTFHSF